MQKMVFCPSNANKHAFVHSSIDYMFYRPISARVPGPMEEAVNWLNWVKGDNFVNSLMESRCTFPLVASIGSLF